MAKRKAFVVPKKWVRIDNSAGTIALRGKSGLFKGRRVTRGTGDRTRAVRVVRDIDFNKDNKIDVFGGSIVGRTSSSGKSGTVYVKATHRAKGYERRV